MALVPFRYNLRSLWVRRSSTLLCVGAVGATVAVLAFMLSLQQGFLSLFQQRGRDDIAVFLRKGATSEGESGLTRDNCDVIVKETPEILTDANGQPMASAELFLAVRRHKKDGGEVNAVLRGVQPMSFAVHGDDLQIVQGERFKQGTDEVIVGEGLVDRLADCTVGAVIQINTTPFRVAGVFRGKGGYVSEIWGDLDRMQQALQRPVRSRVIARVRPDMDFAAVTARYTDDLRVQPTVQSEQQYLASQTGTLTELFAVLGYFLATVMGIAAVFTGTNAMLSAISSRMHEIGVLLSIGFRPGAIFLSFLGEAVVLGLLGGVAGCLLVLPFQGMQTGTMNQETFTEVTFAFGANGSVLLSSIAFAGLLGLIGGAWPAWRASRLQPTQAMRRG